MSEQAGVVEVRKQLERSLQRTLPEAVWEDLVADGLIKDHLAGELEPGNPKESWRALREAANKRLRFRERVLSEALGDEQETREAPTEEREQEQEEKLETDSLVGRRTKAMARAMSAFFALLADQYPEVEEFREKILRGRFPLSSDEAHALIASYAARVFSPKWFAEWDIPVVDHRAQILDTGPGGENFNPAGGWMTIRVDPPGITKTVHYTYPRNGDSHTRCVTKNGAVVPIITGLPIESHGAHVYPAWLWPGSVVDNLYELSVELANAFDWPRSLMDTVGRSRNEAAVRFVLTGEAPDVRPLDGEWESKTSKYFYPQWRIRLTIPPWLPAEEVSRAYRLLKKQAPKGRELPKTTTPLEVARFVWEHERLYGYKEPRRWSTLFKRWKIENADAKIKNYRHFRTLFFRGDTAVKELNYNWPQSRTREP